MSKFLQLLAFANTTLFITLHTQAQKESVRVTDLLKIKSAGEPRLNKEGTKAVFTLTSIEPEIDPKAAKWDYKYVTQLYIVPTDASTAPRQLTARELWAIDLPRLLPR